MATLTKIQAGALGAVLLVGVATSVVVQHHAQGALRVQDELLQRQSGEVVRQQAENERLASLVQAGDSRVNNLYDLVSIRGEVEALRKQTNSLAASLLENRRLRAGSAPQPNASPSILQVREEEKEWNIARMNYTRQWLLAFQNFADKNHDQFPTTFEEARPFLSGEPTAETNLTAEQFEILYRGPTTNIASPSLVVVLREKQARRGSDGKWSRAYAFADGHSEVTSSPDGNFDAWEKRHIILPPPDR
jgi:hypothetical protein